MRPVELPLGRDAEPDRRPSREEVAALWAQAVRQPIPDYDGETLRKFLQMRARR